MGLFYEGGSRLLFGEEVSQYQTYSTSSCCFLLGLISQCLFFWCWTGLVWFMSNRKSCSSSPSRWEVMRHLISIYEKWAILSAATCHLLFALVERWLENEVIEWVCLTLFDTNIGQRRWKLIEDLEGLLGRYSLVIEWTSDISRKLDGCIYLL